MDYSERLGSFVVGAYPDLVMYHLPRGIRSFRQQYPEVHIRLRARPYSTLVQLVKSGDVDLALCTQPPGDDSSLEFKGLFEYNVVLMTPPDHPLLTTNPVRLEDIAEWPLIALGPESSTRRKVEQTLKDQNVSYDFALEMDNTELIKRYVEIGLGVAIASDFTLHQEDHDKLGVARLDHLFPSFRIGMCTLKGKFLGKAVRNFMDALSEELTGFHQEFTDWNNSGVSPNPVAVADTISD
jgi:DNA-binding transcriptional LysR family regulator